MAPLSIIPTLVIIALALLTMEVSDRIFHIRPAKGRFGPIDGLRGYLAFFVFLHHSAFWYIYLRTRQWDSLPSNLYEHFGATSVAVFFMITSFLFFTKLLNARSTSLDWLRLYIGRVMRIMPLYLVVIGLLFIIAAAFSHFRVRQSLPAILWEMLQWLAFISTDINGIVSTQLIVAGVVWSLAFEWLFYCMLPFFGLFFFRIKASLLTVSLTSFFLLFFIWVIALFYPRTAIHRLMPFLGGIAAAFLVRDDRVRKLAAHWVISVGILISLFVIVRFYNSINYQRIPFLLLVLSFVAIACGNSLFGILTHRLSRTLGQISYSIYLLHGIILFVTFQFILGWNKAASLSPTEHWAVIAACGVVVVLACSITYKYIEVPGMNATPKIEEKLREITLRRSARIRSSST